VVYTRVYNGVYASLPTVYNGVYASLPTVYTRVVCLPSVYPGGMSPYVHRWVCLPMYTGGYASLCGVPQGGIYPGRVYLRVVYNPGIRGSREPFNTVNPGIRGSREPFNTVILKEARLASHHPFHGWARSGLLAPLLVYPGWYIPVYASLPISLCRCIPPGTHPGMPCS